MNTRALGITGEQLAVEYLVKSGYKILERNYKSKIGEIDIIAWDNNQIVFVEVKSRNYLSHGTGIESVTPDKIFKIVKTAEIYLLSKHRLNTDCRFDIILTTDEQVIEHIPNAFTKADAGRKKHW